MHILQQKQLMPASRYLLPQKDLDRSPSKFWLTQNSDTFETVVIFHIEK